jgi:molybdenum cofactor biosynthesis enzyme MoaA
MRCLFPWTQVYVENDALVKPCCSSIELGNLRDTRLADIPFSAQAQSLRKAMAASAQDDLPRDCVGCYALARLAGRHTFELTYPLGADTELALRDLERQGHGAFAHNYRTVKQAYEKGTQLPRGARPLAIWGNLGTHCNIRCIMCWQDHVNPLKLTDEQIDNIKELIPTCHTLQLVGGEPTVYKSFWDLADYFREHAIPQARFLMLTNGLLLTRDKLERLDGIEHVNFCVNIDGPSKESYEKIRFGGKWEVLIDNLRTLNAYRRKHGKKNWCLSLAFTLMRSNVGMIEEGIKMADAFDAGWHCGVIFGEHAPIEQCPVFFDENVFRFAHLGLSKDDILARLSAAIPTARRLRTAPDTAVTCLEATMQYVRNTEQVRIPPDRVARMRAITDKFKLSAEIQDCMATYSGSGAKRTTISELIQIVGVRRKERGQDDQATIAAVLELAKGHVARGEHAEALPHFRHALAFHQQNAGTDAKSAAAIALELAKCHMALGQTADAEPHARQAHAWAEQSLGANHSVTRAAALELATCLNALSRHAEPLPLLRSTLAYYESALGPKHSYTIRTVFELARSLTAAGARAESEPHWSRALAYCQAAFGSDHSYTAVAAHELARCRAAQGDHAAAVALLEGALDYFRRALGPQHAATAGAASELHAWRTEMQSARAAA